MYSHSQPQWLIGPGYSNYWSPFPRRNTAGHLFWYNVWITLEYVLWFYHALITEKVTQMEDERAPCTSWRGRLDPSGFVFLPAYSGGESVTLLHNSCLCIQESSWQIFAESSLWAVCPWYNEVTMLPCNIQHAAAPWTCTVLTWHQDSCTECSFLSSPVPCWLWHRTWRTDQRLSDRWGWG